MTAAPTSPALNPESADRQRIESRNALALQWKGLVTYVMRLVAHVGDVRSACEEDLRQIAWLELLRAAEAYDPAYGVKLSYIAIPRMKVAVLRAAMKNTLVRVPPGMCLASRKKGDELTAGEQDRVKYARAANTAMKPVDDESLLVNAEKDQRRREEIADADWAVNCLLNWVNPRSREMVKLYYGLGDKNGETHTLQKIGDHYGLSAERVRQLIEQSLQVMRNAAPIACPDLSLAQNPSLPDRTPRKRKKTAEVAEHAVA